MMKKLSVLVLVLVSLFMPLFAGGAGEKADPSAALAAEYEPAEISFMWWGNDTRNAATIAAGDIYMEQNPGESIVYMPNPFDGYHDKIIIQLANGTAPDLFCFSTEWMGEVGFAENPVLLDLNLVSDEYLDTSTIDPNLLAGGGYNGKLFGIPTGVSGWMFGYYKAALDEYVAKTGAPYPPAPGETWTLEEMYEYGKAYHEAMGPTSCLFHTSQELGNFLVYVLSELNGEFYLDESCHLTFTEDKLLEAFKIVKAFTEAGVLPPPALQVEMYAGGTDNYLATGAAGGAFMWTSNIAEHEGKVNTSVVPMAYPVIGRPENDGLFIRPAQFWSIKSTSEHPNNAAKLLNFIVNSPDAIRALGLERSVPPTQTGQDVLAEAGMLEGNVYESTAYLMESAGAPYNWFILQTQVIDEIEDYYQEVILDKMTPEEAAPSLMASLEKITAEVRANNNLE